MTAFVPSPVLFTSRRSQHSISTKSCQHYRLVMNTSPKIFVAGGSGRLGRRVVRVLAERDLSVTVGARDPVKAERIIKEYFSEASLDRTANVSYVQYDATEPSSVQYERVFRSGVDFVVDVMGTTELRPLAPYKIDYLANCELIRAAASNQGVKHFVLVTSLGTGRWGWPAGALNLFFGILWWKRRAEKCLIDEYNKRAGQSRGGIGEYTIVRPGGLERATDDWKRTHAVRLSAADTQFRGTVSRLQVAEVCVEALLHPEESKNKIIEVTSEESSQETDIVDRMRRL